jgi:hypothetical protein
MTAKFSKSWFGKVSFNMDEFSAEQVGVHVFRAGQECRLFKVNVGIFEHPDFWQVIHERAEQVFASPIDIKGTCPVCHMPRRMWERRYKDYKFCGWCGGKL